MAEKDKSHMRNLVEAGFSARGYHPEVTAVLVSGPHFLKAVEITQKVVYINSLVAVTVFEPPRHIVSGVMQENLDIVGFMNDQGLLVEVQRKKGGELL